ncbi:thioesterase family protein [Spirillospora sp. NPDC029432]|uniref:acyl-CoA thioesterase n=1 Tax=Spirillospora sp. NPDC029432 TaxID=3154599 RepID=UPI003452D1DD
MADEQSEAFTHRIRVRYSDCDMQGVVFNSNYFVYLDDTMDMWLQERLGRHFHEEFDYMVKKASLEWDAPARMREVVEMRPEVTRWGRSSFDVRVRLSVEGRPVGTAEFVFISVKPGAHEPPVTVPVPDEVRAALS